MSFPEQVPHRDLPFIIPGSSWHVGTQDRELQGKEEPPTLQAPAAGSLLLGRMLLDPSRHLFDFRPLRVDDLLSHRF